MLLLKRQHKLQKSEQKEKNYPSKQAKNDPFIPLRYT